MKWHLAGYRDYRGYRNDATRCVKPKIKPKLKRLSAQTANPFLRPPQPLAKRTLKKRYQTWLLVGAGLALCQSMVFMGQSSEPNGNPPFNPQTDTDPKPMHRKAQNCAPIVKPHCYLACLPRQHSINFCNH